MTRSWDMNLDLKGIYRAKDEGIADGLQKAGEHILGVSNDHAPIEEGTMIRSSQVTVDADHKRAGISYDTPYAPEQHEDLTLHHDAGRNAKFLENAMNSERETALKIIGNAINAKLGG